MKNISEGFFLSENFQVFLGEFFFRFFLLYRRVFVMSLFVVSLYKSLGNTCLDHTHQ